MIWRGRDRGHRRKKSTFATTGWRGRGQSGRNERANEAAWRAPDVRFLQACQLLLPWAFQTPRYTAADVRKLCQRLPLLGRFALCSYTTRAAAQARETDKSPEAIIPQRGQQQNTVASLQPQTATDICFTRGRKNRARIQRLSSREDENENRQLRNKNPAATSTPREKMGGGWHPAGGKTAPSPAPRNTRETQNDDRSERGREEGLSGGESGNTTSPALLDTLRSRVLESWLQHS